MTVWEVVWNDSSLFLWNNCFRAFASNRHVTKLDAHGGCRDINCRPPPTPPQRPQSMIVVLTKSSFDAIATAIDHNAIASGCFPPGRRDLPIPSPQFVLSKCVAHIHLPLVFRPFHVISISHKSTLCQRYISRLAIAYLYWIVFASCYEAFAIDLMVAVLSWCWTQFATLAAA